MPMPPVHVLSNHTICDSKGSGSFGDALRMMHWKAPCLPSVEGGNDVGVRRHDGAQYYSRLKTRNRIVQLRCCPRIFTSYSALLEVWVFFRTYW